MNETFLFLGNTQKKFPFILRDRLSGNQVSLRYNIFSINPLTRILVKFLPFFQKLLKLISNIGHNSFFIYPTKLRRFSIIFTTQVKLSTYRWRLQDTKWGFQSFIQLPTQLILALKDLMEHKDWMAQLNHKKLHRLPGLLPTKNLFPRYSICPTTLSSLSSSCHP